MASRIKASLKKFHLVNSLNAAIKARATKRTYRNIIERYRQHPSPCPAPRPPIRQRLPGTVLRIFFAGTDEQQDRGGLIQALARLGNLSCFTRADGSYGQNDPRPEGVRRKANAERLWELVSAAAAQGEAPDILIAQTWATLIDPTVFSRIRRRFGTLIVNIAMDDRHQYFGRPLDDSWGGTFGLIPHIDLALTAAPEAVAWYEKEGCPALFFPEASDPDIFRPMPQIPKIHEVSFVGGRYGIREKMVNALRRSGIDVAAYGSGWELGRIDTASVPALFARSKIVLGVGTIGHCRDFYALKMRDFDGPMSGSLYLTHDNPDLHPLFDVGREIATYRSVAECVEKARYFLARDEERESIAAAGRARAAQDHTWAARFGKLFATLYPGS